LAPHCEPPTLSNRVGCRLTKDSGSSQGIPMAVTSRAASGGEFSLEGMLDSFTQHKNVTVNLNTPAAR